MLSGAKRFTSTASGRLMGDPDRSRGLATTVRQNRRFNTEADMASGISSGTGGGGFGASSTVVDKNVANGFLDGFLPPGDMYTRNKIYKDIYDHDPICGNAVDILSMLPFSDFTLKGIKDHEMLDTYADCCESLRLKILLPSLSKDYLAMGKFIGSMFFDEEKKYFTAIMPQNVQYCDIQEVPIMGFDPLVNLKVPPNLKKFINKGDPRVKRLIDTMPEDFKAFMNQGSVPLQPENTLYIPRRGLSTDSIGTSLYERVLMWHLLEKTLSRGTVDMAQRRQRGIMHIVVSGTDDFVASPTDLENVKQMFAMADADPTGAIIVTRDGINASEVAEGGSFWRWDESVETINAQKYRALGISEALLSGDASYSTLDASMSIFVEQLKAYRGVITREIFYDKIFPSIASANDYTKEGYETTGSFKSQKEKRDHYRRRNMVLCSDDSHDFKIGAQSFDVKNLVMPTITWTKSLAPVGDQAALDMMKELNEMGIPVPMAAMVAAGGMNIDEIFSNMDDELALRKELMKYNKKLAKYPAVEGGGEEGGGGYEANARFMQSLASGSTLKPSRTKFLSRNADERADIHEKNHKGKFRQTSLKGSNQYKEKYMRRMAKALGDIRDREAVKERKKYENDRDRDNRRRVYDRAPTKSPFGAL